MGFFTASHLKKMKKNFRAKNLEKAVYYAEKIDPSEVRTAYDLSMMADIYMCAANYEAAKNVYAAMYNRNKSARTCKQLIRLCIKQNKVKEALQYIKELKRIDEEDYERFIFQYQIGQKLGQDDEYLLACLLKVREADYIDIWALELAKLYYKMGMTDECIGECRNIKLWFPETEFAQKADVILEACADGASYEEAVSMVDGASYDEYYAAPVADEYTELSQNVSEVATGYEEDYEQEIAASLNGYVEEDEAPVADDLDAESEFDFSDEEVADEDDLDDYDEDDDEISMEEFLARKAAQNGAEDLTEEEELQDEEVADEEAGYELEDEFYIEDADEFRTSDANYYAEDMDVEDFDEDDDDDDEASEEEIMAMLARKKAMQQESEKTPYEMEFTEDDAAGFEEDIDPMFSQDALDIDPTFSQDEDSIDNRVELTTHTLINDNLTNDVLAALLEQDKLGQLGEDDEVDNSIIKMLNED